MGLRRSQFVLGAVHKVKGKPYVQANQQKADGERKAGSIFDAQFLLTNHLEFEGCTFTRKFGASVPMWCGSHWPPWDHTAGCSKAGKIRPVSHPLCQITPVWAGLVHLGETEAAGWSISAANGAGLMSAAITRDPIGPARHCALFPSADKGLLHQEKKKIK